MSTIFLIIAIVSYSLTGIFLSRAAGKMDASLVTALSNSVAVALPLVLYFYMKFAGRVESVQTKTSGIIFTILAGAAVAIFGIALTKLFEKGGNLGYVMPAVYGGAIVITTLVGIFFFKEEVSLYSILGVILVALGIGFITFSKVA